MTRKHSGRAPAKRKHHKTLKKQQLNNPTTKFVSPEQKAIKSRITALCHKKKNEHNKSFYRVFHKLHLLAFAEFIDNPFCYNKGLIGLYQCQSKVKPLQKRQRITLVKVVTALFSRLELESYQIGFCNSSEFMDTIAHSYKDKSDRREGIRDIYEKMWGESISEKRYYAAINQLKLADFYYSESIYRYQVDAERQQQNDSDEEKEIPTIKSHASYKGFYHRFFQIFNLEDNEDAIKSKEDGIKERKDRGYTTCWVSYQAFSDSFYSLFWSKRKDARLKRGDAERYPQRTPPKPSIYGSQTLPMH